MLVALMLWYRVPPHWPIAPDRRGSSCTLCSRRSVALFVAMANLFYRDVKYIFEVAITLWMFATSVLYPVHQVTDSQACSSDSTR